MSQDQSSMKLHIVNMLSKPGAEYSIDQIARAFAGGKSHEKNCVTVKTYLSDMRSMGKLWSNQADINGGKPFLTKGVKKGSITYYHRETVTPENNPASNLSQSKPGGDYLLKESLVLEGSRGGEFSLSNEEAGKLAENPLPIVPTGNRNPLSVTQEVVQFQRDNSVRDWVIQQAKGKCECCGRRSPFTKTDGLPYGVGAI